MDDKIMQALIGLLRYEIYQIPLSEKMTDLLQSVDMQQLYELSLKHDLAHMAGDALEKNQLLQEDHPTTELFEKQNMLAFFRYKQLTYEFERLCNILEEAKICFLPVKGNVIRKLYPEEWMRTSCDVDILVHAEDMERAEQVLKGKLEYRRSGRSPHDISFSSPTDVHVELHFSLLESERMPKTTAVLSRVWEYVTPVPGQIYQMELSPEMIYFYHIAHMAKHVQTGGCGIRFFLDTKILFEKLETDSQKKKELLEEGNLAVFENYAVGLSDVWFGDGEMNEELFSLHRFIIDGGIYGDMSNTLAGNTQEREKNAFQYFLSRLFPPKNIIFVGYPTAKKHPWLLPVFYVIRPFHRLFTVNKRRLMREMQIQNNMSDEKKNSIDHLFSMLGF